MRCSLFRWLNGKRARMCNKDWELCWCYILIGWNSNYCNMNEAALSAFSALSPFLSISFSFSLFTWLLTVSDKLIYHYFQVKLNNNKNCPFPHIHSTCRRSKRTEKLSIQAANLSLLFYATAEAFIFTNSTLSNMFPLIFHTNIFLNSCFSSFFRWHQ